MYLNVSFAQSNFGRRSTSFALQLTRSTQALNYVQTVDGRSPDRQFSRGVNCHALDTDRQVPLSSTV